MKKLFCLPIFAMAMVSCGVSQYAIMSDDEYLTALTKITDNEDPCVSPCGGDDGKNLFFAVYEDEEYYNIYKKENPFASAMNQKTSGKNHNFSPTYCAATDKLAFRCQNEGSSTSDIYMMSASKGRALTQVSESADAYENNPCFSKDGKYLVYDKRSYSYSYYVSFRSLLGYGISSELVAKSEIWLKNLQTGENTLLGGGYQPNFSPDGKSVVFVKYSEDAESCSIWTMDIDGDNQVQITDAKKGYAFYPRWSPDGNRIVFQLTKKDKEDADIYVIDADGDNLTQITKNKSYDGTPYWTTDGYIYFVSDRGGKSENYQIWRFKAE